MSVVKFPGKTPETNKEIYGCNECGSRSFKLSTYGASSEILVECSNCECRQRGFIVKFEEQP